ncbi:GntR family transcriptional regulator [Streptomyces sp. NPDC051569]|uniref:GntR family transcriptional regulator n=1 Tax=Streptomyces sp. NPDC051569 TaxID=3365661 RepID=UPI00379929F1
MATEGGGRQPHHRRVVDPLREAESHEGAGMFVRPLRRRGVQRLSRELWGEGRSIWSADIEERSLVVDQVHVTEEAAPERIARVLDLAPGDAVCVRNRRYVLDGKPVLLATSFLPAALVAGSAVTREDPGPGGIYARLEELGFGPVHFREEVRSRMPSQDETRRLSLSPGRPVMLIGRSAFAATGRPVEVNEMTLDSASYVLEYDFDA